MIDIPLTGFVTLRLLNRAGDPVEKEIDLFEFYNGLLDAGAECAKAGDNRGAAAARVAYLKEAGFDVSQTVATLTIDRLSAAVLDVQKKSLSTEPAATPASTGSPSGPTTAGG